ncbi:MAG: hypothetical protein EBZ74_10525 [Planctomycetia bacterium]|nr:hypothetical protein [Planctomycetia bacterium]
MRDDLVGYLLNALDQPEARRIETALADPHEGPALHRDLEALRSALGVLDRDRETLPAPPGLAARTLAFVAAQSAGRPLPVPRAFSTNADEAGGGPRAWLDRAIIAAIAMAACVLLAPLLLDAVSDARARRAERNLQQASLALQGYAESHRVFPTPPDSGPLSRAGLYAPTLVSEQRLVADDGTLLVPGTAIDRQGGFRIPSLDEVEAAVGTPRFEEMVRLMGGDYGYTLGHRDASGALKPNANLRRVHQPLMADAPDDSCQKSTNHPGGLHLILYEDGHIERVREENLHRDDHLYKNHAGKTAAGVDADDAVIGDSHHQP